MLFLKKFLLALMLITSFTKPLLAQEPIQKKQEAAREKLLLMMAGEWISRSIYVAAKLEIADHLSSPKSTKELAALTAANPDSLYRLMHLLASFEIFEEVSPGIFANTEASLLLAKTNPDTLQALSLFYGEDIHKCWDGLLSSIQEGVPAFDLTYKQPVFSYFKDFPSQAALFQEAMKQKSKAVAGSTALSYNFGLANSVYDIGGGYGQFMQTLLGTYPNLNGLLFDLSEVIETVKKNQSNENPRLKLAAGDFFESIPKGGDLYLLKSVLHDWDDTKSEQILKNCYEAMGENSRLLIVEVVLLPKDNSLYANCMDLLMLAITGGKERSLSSFTDLFEKTGFVLENIYPTTTEFSILEVRKK